MTGKDTGADDGAALWRRARTPWRETAGGPEAPDALSLAAYLEGALDQQAAEYVETWMAVSDEGLDSVLAARAALAAPAAEVPGQVIARARGIVRRRRSPARSGSGWRAAIFGGFETLLGPAAWAGAAAALLLACVSGFELGRMGVEHLASLDATVSQDVRLVMGRTDSDLL